MKEINKTGFYNVKDKVFYHLFSYKKINVGDIIEAGTQANGIHKRVYHRDFRINGQSTHDIVAKAYNRKVFKFLGKTRLKQVANVLNNYDFALRELALENERAANFKNYPSRFSCIYVVNEMQEAIDWAPRLLWQRPCCQLVKLKCTGKVFVGDSKYNKKDNYDFQKSLEIAKGYWEGGVSKTPQLEILFEGKAEVLEVIKHLN